MSGQLRIGRNNIYGLHSIGSHTTYARAGFIRTAQWYTRLFGRSDSSATAAGLDSTAERMLSFPGSVKIYLAVNPCDMRKSFNGLYALAVEQLGEDPTQGGLFLFSNRRRNRLKILYWDGSGLWVLNKRLEQGCFSWPKGCNTQGSKLHLSNESLALLVGGVNLKQGMKKAWYER